nr:PREDICTED: pancreatic triacylglycerol lipase-like isoform X2 [Megachile rotundata]
MFVNETMLILAYTANMMATLPEKVGSQAIDTNIEKQNVTTTTLSPEEKENQFDLQDQWYMWRCFEPYGCFYIGAPWSGENRPVSTFPARPDSINPRYVLYTRGHTEPQELKIDKYETIQQSPFRKKANLYLIIHGFLDNGDKTWVMRTMKELLLREDCNVVVVNWIGGAGPPYTQAVANTRLVGAMTARLAYQLIEVGRIDPAKMHCIGHSLGAHTCGYVGYTLRQRYDYKLGRITGIKRFLGCNHIRSYEYFIESINTNCPFLAVPCSSWDKFEEGSCFDCVNQYCPRFGLDAQPGNYHASVYLLTGSSKPFCKGHYKVTINISKTDESVNHGGEVGTFVIRIFGEKDKKSERIHLSPHSKYYEPGSTHTVVLAGDVVGKPEAIEISWEYQASVFNPLTWRLLHTPRVYIDSLTIYSLESSHGITVCPDATKTLIANEPKILTMKNCRNAESNLVSA